jgi:beta-glucosidase
VTLVAEPRIVAEYDTRLPGWRIAGGTYRVALARDATDRSMLSTATLLPRSIKP